MRSRIQPLRQSTKGVGGREGEGNEIREREELREAGVGGPRGYSPRNVFASRSGRQIGARSREPYTYTVAE